MKLQARKAFRYAGRSLKVGDTFDASAKDVKILTAIGHACEAADDLGEPAPTAEPESPKSDKYKRRDMRAG